MKYSSKIGNVELRNPVIVTSGEHGRDGDTIVEVASSGVGAVTTKSIVPFPIPDPLPCYATMKNGFLNCVLAAILPAETWFKEEIPKACGGGIPVIANLAGTSPEQAADLAEQAVAAGAAIVELPTHCPHLAENLAAQFPDMEIPPPEIDDPRPFFETVKAVRNAVDVPIIGKLSAVFSHNCIDWVKAGMDGGMDVVEVTDTFGPVMRIDIETGQPKLGGPRGFGAMSGGALKPIALRMVFEIAQQLDIPIIASGGINNWKDAVEYIMAGAELIGVCTVGHLKGVETYTKLIQDLDTYFSEKNCTIDDIRGLALKKVEERKQNNWTSIVKPIPPEIDGSTCNACGMCATSCIYDAISINGTAVIDKNACYGCGLCVDVCPTGAIKSGYYTL